MIRGSDSSIALMQQPLQQFIQQVPTEKSRTLFVTFRLGIYLSQDWLIPMYK